MVYWMDEPAIVTLSSLKNGVYLRTKIVMIWYWTIIVMIWYWTIIVKQSVKLYSMILRWLKELISVNKFVIPRIKFKQNGMLLKL